MLIWSSFTDLHNPTAKSSKALLQSSNSHLKHFCLLMYPWGAKIHGACMTPIASAQLERLSVSPPMRFDPRLWSQKHKALEQKSSVYVTSCILWFFSECSNKVPLNWIAPNLPGGWTLVTVAYLPWVLWNFTRSLMFTSETPSPYVIIKVSLIWLFILLWRPPVCFTRINHGYFPTFTFLWNYVDSCILQINREIGVMRYYLAKYSLSTYPFTRNIQWNQWFRDAQKFSWYAKLLGDHQLSPLAWADSSSLLINAFRTRPQGLQLSSKFLPVHWQSLSCSENALLDKLPILKFRRSIQPLGRSCSLILFAQRIKFRLLKPHCYHLIITPFLAESSKNLKHNLQTSSDDLYSLPVSSGGT